MVLAKLGNAEHGSPMNIELLRGREIEAMREAGAVASATLAAVCEQLRSGMSTAEIDRLVRADTCRRGALPSQLGYQGFPAAVCTSLNQVVCHGIPSSQERLKDGDIINVDVTSNLRGFHGDTSRTILIGTVSAEAQRLVSVAEACVQQAIRKVRPGVRLGDLGALICDIAEDAGYSVVQELGGHGIGRQMHMAPHVPYGRSPGSGVRLKEGMAFTIEPMINQGRPEVRFLDDGWTVVTADGSLSAQFEHTVLVIRDGCEVLTQPSAAPGARDGQSQ